MNRVNTVFVTSSFVPPGSMYTTGQCLIQQDIYVHGEVED